MTARPAVPVAARPWLLRGAALLAGGVAALGQAPWGLWYLALPAYALLTWAVSEAPSGRAALGLGLIGGAAHFAVALSWVYHPFLVDAAQDGWMAPFAVVLLAGGLALFWGAAAMLARRGAIAFAVALSLAELARGHVLTGFPWALPGHVWIDTPLGQTAALWGGYGLTALTLLAAALPMAAGWRGVVLGGLALSAAWGWGALRLAAPLPRDRAEVVRLVQPNADQAAKWVAGLAEAHFDRLLRLTSAPPGAAGPPALVIWPETSLPYLLDKPAYITAEIAAAGGGVPVIVGAQRVDGARGWNSLAVITPEATVGPVYDKHHLVPFGEYIPAGDALFDWLGISAFASQMGAGYSAGPGAQVLDLGPALGRVVPVICYEAVFPAIPRQAQAAGGRAGWMVQITNDAWFGTATGPFQHLALARLRAIEQGLPLLRAANTGVSAVIDARGQVRASLGMGREGVIDAALPGAMPPPPYARLGDLPVLAVLLAALAALVLPHRRKQSLDAPPPPR